MLFLLCKMEKVQEHQMPDANICMTRIKECSLKKWLCGSDLKSTDIIPYPASGNKLKVKVMENKIHFFLIHRF